MRDMSTQISWPRADDTTGLSDGTSGFDARTQSSLSATCINAGGYRCVSVYIPTPFRELRRQPHQRRGRGRATSPRCWPTSTRSSRASATSAATASGAIPAHINIYVNNKEISTLDGAATQLDDGDQVAVIPALAGGAATDGGAVRAHRVRADAGARHALLAAHHHAARSAASASARSSTRRC